MKAFAERHSRLTVTLCMILAFLLVHNFSTYDLKQMRTPSPMAAVGDGRSSLEAPASTGPSQVLSDGTTRNSTWKMVLFWSRWFNSDWSGRFRGSTSRLLREEGCPSWRCHFTYNRSLLQGADAVLFRADEYPWRRLPTRRVPPDQRWVLVNVEAPPAAAPISGPSQRQASALINWTMTYHSHSDVVAFYGYFLSYNVSVRPVRPNMIWEHWKAMDQQREALKRGATLQEVLGPAWRSFVNKTRVVAWMSSHCKTRSRREEYITQLEKYLHVDKYGSCGPLKCGKRSPRGSWCWKNVLHKYSFYLSMENSLCSEYVTEKLYNPLVYGIVPVVWGGADYSWFLPPHSYINARHYHPKELAALLLRLHNDPVAYGRYHLWRAYLQPVVQGSLCELCDRLHHDKHHKHHHDIPAARHANGRCLTLPTPLFTTKHHRGAWRAVNTTNYIGLDAEGNAR
ncbi:alpha-(1,3)-fucosyltransferase C-like isoform X2 [Panulirus ornatus]